MALPRFHVSQLTGNSSIELSRQDARHALNVLRLRVGDELQLFDGLGHEGKGRITNCGPSGVAVEVQAIDSISRELSGQLDLFVSLPKGDRQKTLVDMLVQLGVHSLTPLKCQRSVAQPTSEALKRIERWAIESNKQCGRNQLMQIKPSIAVSELPHQKSCGLFAHPHGTSNPLLSTLNNPDSPHQSLQAAIGPEGGFTDDECGLLIELGWQPVSLGNRILRIETAAVMVASIWAAWNREACV